MAAELQTYMARRGAKAFMMLLLLSCLGLLTRYYRFDTNASHYRRAIFFRNDSSIDAAPVNNQLSWTDPNGKK